MDIPEDELRTDDAKTADDVFREAWTVPPGDDIREFEEYLMGIGIRF